MTGAYRAVIFDLDGTLTPVRSVWRHIHEALGLWEEEARRHQEAFTAGRIDYAEFCRRDAAHWKGLPERRLRAITDAIPYRPGAREAALALRAAGLFVGVVSTGLTLLAERVRDELDLAFTIANRLEVRNGLLTGDVRINVEHRRKGEAIDLFCGRFGVAPAEIIAVGDSDGDISMFERSGFAVALHAADERTRRAADLEHAGDSLLDLLPRLPIPGFEGRAERRRAAGRVTEGGGA